MPKAAEEKMKTKFLYISPEIKSTLKYLHYYKVPVYLISPITTLKRNKNLYKIFHKAPDCLQKIISQQPWYHPSCFSTLVLLTSYQITRAPVFRIIFQKEVVLNLTIYFFQKAKIPYVINKFTIIWKSPTSLASLKSKQRFRL